MSKSREMGSNTMDTKALRKPKLNHASATPLKRTTRLWKAFALVGLLVGCGSRVDPGTDGSTHWLSCNTDAECGGVRCLDHRCAKPTVNPKPSNTSSQPATSTPSTPTPGANSQRALGEICLPAAEYQPEFRGFAEDDVTIDLGAQCATGACLVNHFRGRVTCLYGSEPADGGFHDCETPDGSPVTATVAPQLQDRSPENAVYCSCRCDGPDPSADYCECGDGFECLPVAPVEVSGAAEVTGSYCVKSGTGYDRFGLHRPCDADTASCGEAARYSAQTLGVDVNEEQLGSTSSFEYIAGLLSNPTGQDVCLPRPLPVVDDGDGLGAACRVFELRRGGPGCDVPARLPAEETAERVAREYMWSIDVCSNESDCGEFSVCEVPQIRDANSGCRTQEEITEDGWCYVSESPALGNPELLASCHEALPHGRLRFGGAGVIDAASYSYIACSGKL